MAGFEVITEVARYTLPYFQEGTITTAFDIRVQNDLDRFHLVQDVIDRVPNLGSKGVYLKQMMQDKLIQHKHYIDKHREDLPEIRNWKWTGASKAAVVPSPAPAAG
jgi:xylulose-5-phosphate/fructose-6-phosphate phosphoketolase